MQTYYELEDYHYKMIKKAGFKIGCEVYFKYPYAYKTNLIKNGVIERFDITTSGDILFIIKHEIIEKINENEWNTQKEYKRISCETVRMDEVKHHMKDTIKIHMTHILDEIEEFIENIKYRLDEMEKLKKQLEER